MWLIIMQIEKNTYNALYPVISEINMEMKGLNVCFLLTHIPNPRMNKRIELFKQVAQTRVICTRRSSQNIYEPSQDVEHVIFDIDLPSAKHIIKRYIISRKFKKKALEKLEQFQPNVIYTEGLDALIIAGKYKKKYDGRIFFEVADLRENYITKPKKLNEKIITKILLKTEKMAFGNVNYLIVTSPKFYEMHYNTLIPKSRTLFIPNTPDISVFQHYKKKNEGKFTVGFIGGIRYIKQMKMLVDAAEIVDCNVLFAGAGGTSSEYNEIKEYCKDMKNVIFTGRYDYEKEIASLYGKVDCVYSVYDVDNPNVKIALPNKLYESILCELPIIVAKNTYLAELVKQYGVGIAVSHEDKEDLKQVLIALKNDKRYCDAIAERCHSCKVNLVGEMPQEELLRVASEGTKND